MRVVWSDSAKRQLRDILVTIRHELSPEDAQAWYERFAKASAQLEDFPNIGVRLSSQICNRPCAFFRGVRQLLVGPYRIVYEQQGDICAVLFCQHCRQMVG